MPRLWTARYQNPVLKTRPDLVKVRITLGRPRFRLGYKLVEMPELAPDGWMFHLEGDEFRKKYRQKLCDIGIQWLKSRFEQIRRSENRDELVLLCFEKPGEHCHRHDFAQWWEEKTGQKVEELEDPATVQSRLPM